MSRFNINLDQRIRDIVQDELNKTFGFSSDDSENAYNEPNEAAESSDEIVLPTLSRAPAKGRVKNRGRGRVTKPTDGRLKANKK